MTKTSTRTEKILEVVEVEGIRFRHTAIPGVVVVEPKVHCDDRGLFVETHNQRRYSEGGIDATFVQDNHSESKRGTLRGLHTQIKAPQGKLLRAVEGEIFDVAVDVREEGSPTYGKWFGIRLSAANFRQLYVPPGLLHGFCVLSRTAQVEYKCTDFWDRDDEVSVLWKDPELEIQWPIRKPVLSPRDQTAKPLAEMRELLAGVRPFTK